MWTVIKFDKKNYHLLKEDIKNKLELIVQFIDLKF